jgi:hypothetical protein
MFLDPANLEPHDDQWAYQSSDARLSPSEVTRLSRRLGHVSVGTSETARRPQAEALGPVSMMWGPKRHAIDDGGHQPRIGDSGCPGLALPG